MTKAKVEKPEVIKGLKFEDFLTETNLASPSKMTLQINGIDTDQYLMYIGAKSKQVSKHMGAWAAVVSSASKALKDKGVSDEYAQEINNKVQSAYDIFALALVSDWSLGELTKERLQKFLSEDVNRSVAIVTNAFDKEETLAKK